MNILKNNPIIKFIVLTLTLCFFHPVWASNYDHLLKEPGTLNVCSYDAFTPVSYGNGQGFEADLLKAIAKSWGVKIKFFPESIYEGIWRLPSRTYTKCDVAIGGFSPFEYRIKEGTAFSIPTSSYKQSLLVRKKDYESGRVTSYKSFKNTSMKIGILPGSSGEIFAQEIAHEINLPDSVFIRYPSESALLNALYSGKIDAFARGDVGNDYQAGLHKDLVTIARRDFKETFTFALAKSNPMLVNALNNAILKITHQNKIKYSDWLNDNNIFMKSFTKT